MDPKSERSIEGDLSNLEAIAKQLLAYAGEEKIWFIEGEMGAGKTTFIRALCKVLGVIDNVNSPTFPVINEYRTEKGEAVYHFDFYRIKSLEEAVALDCDTYFESGHYCFIEWPSIVSPLLPKRHITVSITPLSSSKRRFEAFTKN